MFASLFKKQLWELSSFYFFDKKTGKRKSSSNIIGYFILLIFLLGLISFYIFGSSSMLANYLFGEGKDYLFFAVMSILTIGVGVFGSVFTTSASLYNAKDNDLLLSMPIKPIYILIARLLGVLITTMIFTLVVWIPSVVSGLIAGKTISIFFYSVFVYLLINLFTVVITCILGFIITNVGNRLKNKNFAKIIITLLLLAAYYIVYFRLEQYVQSIISNVDKVEKFVSKYLYISILIGKSCVGNIKSLILLVSIIGVLIIITFYILSKSFISMVTRNHGSAKVKYIRRDNKVLSVSNQIVVKEFRRFINCSPYMLNCGLALIILPSCAIYLLFSSNRLFEFLNSVEFEGLGNDPISRFIPILLFGSICFIMSMNYISSPSISLEGKNIWVLQSLPVDPKVIFSSKIKFHLAMNSTAILISIIPFSIALKLDVLNTIFILILSIVFCWLTGVIGLWMNLLNPNLNWSNEVEPVKRGLSTIFTLLISWVIVGVLLSIGFVSMFIHPYLSFVFDLIIMLIIGFSIRFWIMNKGSKIWVRL